MDLQLFGLKAHQTSVGGGGGRGQRLAGEMGSYDNVGKQITVRFHTHAHTHLRNATSPAPFREEAKVVHNFLSSLGRQQQQLYVAMLHAPTHIHTHTHLSCIRANTRCDATYPRFLFPVDTYDDYLLFIANHLGVGGARFDWRR